MTRIAILCLISRAAWLAQVRKARKCRSFHPLDNFRSFPEYVGWADETAMADERKECTSENFKRSVNLRLVLEYLNYASARDRRHKSRSLFFQPHLFTLYVK